MFNSRIWRWNLQRVLIDRLGRLFPFSRTGDLRRVLMISAPDFICHTQLFPFLYHAGELRQRHGIELREVPLSRWVSGEHPYQGEVSAVCLQTWFDLEPQQLRDLIAQIKSRYPHANIAYFDWFAPTDLRYAPVINDEIVLYLKKQVLRDRSVYDGPTLGAKPRKRKV